MSGEVTDQLIDLTEYGTGVFFRIETDYPKTITVFPLDVTTRYDDYFVVTAGVMGLERICDHTRVLITRELTRGTQFRIQNIEGFMQYDLGSITQIVQGNC